MANKYEDRLKDYVQVADRVTAFYAKHPEGSIQSEITHLTDKLVVVKAWAYRSPDDVRPGIGHSSLGIPGTTPYTRGSEVENAETSAWGRAIAALGFEVRKGIATRDEIENKHDDSDNARTNGSGMEDALASARKSLREKAARIIGSDEQGLAWLKEKGITGRTNDLKTLADASLELNGYTQQAENEDQDLNW